MSEIRDNRGLYKKYLDYITKSKLIQSYLKDRLSIVKVANLYNVSKTVIHTYLKHYKIPTRTKSEARVGIRFSEKHKQRLREINSGKNSCHWQGGLPKCLDCGKELSRYGCKFCWECFNKPKNNANFGRVTKYYHLKYNKTYFRSGWEANFAKWCDGSGIKWKYESKTFDLGNTTYTPDFYLPEFDCWIEIKGFFREKAKEKINIFLKLYPELNFKLFEKSDLFEYGVIKK
jgi:predicted DNA-binding protein YlxM (UPF0122 family)